MIKYAVGDVMVFRREGYEPVFHEITEVRDTGYTWQYPDLPNGGDFWSENSNDPFYECGWEKAQ
jgi:hypothetical protein